MIAVRSEIVDSFNKVPIPTIKTNIIRQSDLHKKIINNYILQNNTKNDKLKRNSKIKSHKNQTSLISSLSFNKLNLSENREKMLSKVKKKLIENGKQLQSNEDVTLITPYNIPQGIKQYLDPYVWNKKRVNKKKEIEFERDVHKNYSIKKLAKEKIYAEPFSRKSTEKTRELSFHLNSIKNHPIRPKTQIPIGKFDNELCEELGRTFGTEGDSCVDSKGFHKYISNNYKFHSLECAKERIFTGEFKNNSSIKKNINQIEDYQMLTCSTKPTYCFTSPNEKINSHDSTQNPRKKCKIIKDRIFKSADNVKGNLSEIKSILKLDRKLTKQSIHKERERLINASKPELHEIRQCVQKTKTAFIYSHCMGEYTKLALNQKGLENVLEVLSKEGDDMIRSINSETLYKFREIIQKDDFKMFLRNKSLKYPIDLLKAKYQFEYDNRKKQLEAVKKNNLKIMRINFELKESK